MIKKITSLIFSCGVFFAFNPGAIAYPFTSYTNTNVKTFFSGGTSSCLSEGKDILKKAGFDRIGGSNIQAWGYLGDYTALIICDKDENSSVIFSQTVFTKTVEVHIVVYGPELKQCQRYLNTLELYFSN